MRTTRQATAGGAGQNHRQGGFHLADLVGVLWARGPMFPKTAQDKCAQSLVRGEVLKRTGLHQEDFDQYASRGAGPDRAFAAWVAANLTAEGLAESGELTPEVDGDDDGLPHVAAALAKLHDEGLTAKLLAELWQRWPAVAEARGLPRAEQVRSAPPGGGEVRDAVPPTPKPENERGGKRLKEPSPMAFECYRVHVLAGQSQKATAEMLSCEHGRTVHQGQVSKWIAQVTRWLEAGNILPDLPTCSPAKTTIVVDPDVLPYLPNRDAPCPDRPERQGSRKSLIHQDDDQHGDD